MNNNNLNELKSVGNLDIETVVNFFNIKEENKKLIIDALLDIAGLYTKIEWNADKYVTINLLKKQTKRGNLIYNVNNTHRTNNKTKKIIVDYNPYNINNANSNRRISSFENLLTIMGVKLDVDFTLQELKDKFLEQTKTNNINKMRNRPSYLLTKYELDNLFKKQKQYTLDNKTILFTEGAIVKSQTTGNSFVLLEPLYRTLKLVSMKPRKIYIYKKTTENIYYIYSNWGSIQNYTDVFETKLIQYIIEYIKYIIQKYSIDVDNSKFIFAGHSEGANVSQNLVVGILKINLIPKQNLFLISLSYPQSLTQADLEYLYSNLDGQFISLVAMGYLEDRNSNNVNAKITKKNIRNNKALVNNYTKIYENDNTSNNLKLLKSLCIFFDYNKKLYIPKAIYNLNDYMKIIKNKSTYPYGRNNHSNRQKQAHKFHNFTNFIKTAIISLIPK